MLSLQGDWICFRDRPLISVNPQKKVLSSGCGQTHVLASGGSHPRLKDLIRFTHYRPVSHWLSDTSARVVLQGGDQDQTIILRLACGTEDCRMGVDGLPWDHNRLVFHLAHKPEENCFGGLDRYSRPFSAKSEMERFAWQKGIHAIWANTTHTSPLNGFCTSGGFWVTVLSPALTRFRIADGKPDHAGVSENIIEVWDVSAVLRIGREPDFERGFKRLAGEGTDLFPKSGPTVVPVPPDEKEPVIIRLSGGAAACEKKASGLNPDGARRMLVIEDWQGMKRTLLSSTPNCSWKADPDQYHRLSDLVGGLQSAGHLVGCNVLPFVNLDTELHREASVRGYCLLAQTGHEYEDRARENPVAWIDLTQPKAVDWIQEQIRLLVQTFRIKGILAVMDTPFPRNAAAVGGNVLTLRNQWFQLWFDACRSAFDQDSTVLVLPDV